MTGIRRFERIPRRDLRAIPPGNVKLRDVQLPRATSATSLRFRYCHRQVEGDDRHTQDRKGSMRASPALATVDEPDIASVAFVCDNLKD